MTIPVILQCYFPPTLDTQFVVINSFGLALFTEVYYLDNLKHSMFGRYSLECMRCHPVYIFFFSLLIGRRLILFPVLNMGLKIPNATLRESFTKLFCFPIASNNFFFAVFLRLCIGRRVIFLYDIFK